MCEAAIVACLALSLHMEGAHRKVRVATSVSLGTTASLGKREAEVPGVTVGLPATGCARRRPGRHGRRAVAAPVRGAGPACVEQFAPVTETAVAPLPRRAVNRVGGARLRFEVVLVTFESLFFDSKVHAFVQPGI